MSDNSLVKYFHYGTSAERLVFAPDPPNAQVVYIWYETDTGDTYLYDTAWHQIAGATISNPNPAQNSFLVSGGQIVWISGYQYLVSAAVYYIQGILYASPQTTITLDSSDPTNDRIDVIAVTTSNTVIKVTGDPSPNPSEPDVDVSTQLKLGIVLVQANTTAPPTTSNEVLYYDNAGAPTEWNWTTSGTGFNVNSTNNPKSPSTICIEGTTVASGAYCQGEKGTGTYDPALADLLILYIRSKATWSTNRALAVTLRLSGVIVGATVTIARSGTFGFNSATTGVYQLVAIPISLFAVPLGSTINQIRITASGAGHGFYIDDIFFQLAGASQGGGSGMTQDQADARYLQIALNLTDLSNKATATAQLNAMVGDTGSGGTKGMVPAPAAGDAGLGKYLKADGVWTVPPGGGSGITELTGEVTAGPGSGSQAATIASGVVTNSKLANVPTATIKGRVAASTGSPTDLTTTEATTLINTFIGDTGSGGTKGLVPAPSSGDGAAGKYLNAGGTWTTPATVGISNIYYLDDSASDIATYHVLSTLPLGGTEEIDSASVVVGDGEVLIEAYASNETFGTTVLPAGDWIFHLWRYVSLSAGTSEIVIRVYKRTSGGTETELFNTTTGDINDTTVAEQHITSTQSTFTVGTSDRLVVKFFAKTSSAASITISFTHNGTAHYSKFSTPESTAITDFVGDSGSGGIHGLVPAPSAGDGTTKYLKADGTWAVPYTAPTVYRKVGITVDGSGSAVTTGIKGAIQVDFAGTIIGWSVIADQAGSLTIEVDKKSSSAPPNTPAIPNTTTDKISASAPIELSTAQSAASGTTGVSTWTTSVSQWDVIQFNVATATTCQRVTAYIRIQES